MYNFKNILKKSGVIVKTALEKQAKDAMKPEEAINIIKQSIKIKVAKIRLQKLKKKMKAIQIEKTLQDTRSKKLAATTILEDKLKTIIDDFIGRTKVHTLNSISKSENINRSALPILELYQYEIVNHPTDDTLTSPKEYDSLSDPTDNLECSTYSYGDNPQGTPTTPESKNSLCDIITNGPKIKFNDNIEYYYEYLLNLYKTARLKNSDVLQNEDNMKKIRFPHETILNLILEYEKIFSSFIKLKNEKELIYLQNTTPRPEKRSNNHINHIKKIETNNNEKFICIGDVHGSIHTFIRLLFRFHKYGILNIKTMKINEPYNIVFLGDIIDRGSWGLEIACTLIILLINNPDRMHWNSGNHEEKVTNEHYGFLDEIKYKYKHLDQSIVNNLYNSMNKFFGYLSCAIIIHNVDSDTKYWLAHGGIPQKLQHGNFDSNADPIEPAIPFNEDFYYAGYDDKYTFKKVSDYKKAGYYLVNDETASTIRWSDFPYQNICPYRGTNNFKCNYEDYFINFMKNFGINGIIRGHQDSISNSLVFRKENLNGSMVIFNELKTKEQLHNIYWNDQVDLFKSTRYRGPLARLHINKEDNPYNGNYIQPVVTLSSNTDTERGLTADSFGLLRFDITRDNVNNFDKNILISKNKIKADVLALIKNVLSNKTIYDTMTDATMVDAIIADATMADATMADATDAIAIADTAANAAFVSVSKALVAASIAVDIVTKSNSDIETALTNIAIATNTTTILKESIFTNVQKFATAKIKKIGTSIIKTVNETLMNANKAALIVTNANYEISTIYHDINTAIDTATKALDIATINAATATKAVAKISNHQIKSITKNAYIATYKVAAAANADLVIATIGVKKAISMHDTNIDTKLIIDTFVNKTRDNITNATQSVDHIVKSYNAKLQAEWRTKYLKYKTKYLNLKNKIK